MDEEKKEFFIEIESGKKKGGKSTFLQFDLINAELWVDVSGLPDAFLCASFDGQPARIGQCGEKGNKKITFLRIEWLINEWGGPDEIVEALKKVREIYMGLLEEYRTKYGIKV